MSARAPLTLIVGPENGERDAVAQRLIDRGWSFVVCSGTPGCPLLRDSRCALVEVADIAVFMPAHSERRDVAAQLALCARTARAPVVVAPSSAGLSTTTSSTALSVDAIDVIDAVDEAVRKQRRLTLGKKVTADVVDIWL